MMVFMEQIEEQFRPMVRAAMRGSINRRQSDFGCHRADSFSELQGSRGLAGSHKAGVAGATPTPAPNFPSNPHAACRLPDDRQGPLVADIPPPRASVNRETGSPTSPGRIGNRPPPTLAAANDK